MILVVEEEVEEVDSGVDAVIVVATEVVDTVEGDVDIIPTINQKVQ